MDLLTVHSDSHLSSACYIGEDARCRGRPHCSALGHRVKHMDKKCPWMSKQRTMISSASSRKPVAYSPDTSPFPTLYYPPSLESRPPRYPSFHTTRFPSIPLSRPRHHPHRVLVPHPPRSYSVVVLSVCCISYVNAYCLARLHCLDI